MNPAQRQSDSTDTFDAPAPVHRRTKALAGLALAVPTSIVSVGLATPANAAIVPAQPTHTAVSSPAVASAAKTATQPTLTVPAARGAAKSASGPVLRYGSKGTAVKTLQGKLKISRDGSFGPATRSAVKKFQSRKGLSVDGVVGPKTWGALGGYSGSGKSKGGGSSSSSSSSAVKVAERYIGTPYRYGGSSPSGFDCSGLTKHVFAKLGKSLPRSARAQQAAVKRVGSPKPGDLVFYGYPAYHVGIYVGGGKMIDAPKPGTKVTRRAVYQPEVSGYGRV
ncbi:C40 family peptidase [Demetria terragena]|uniref:C40 family peptidase n=1 Tax=Demetria terragena TaxID=63959 RepID=UPI0003824E5A|nr:NlpC/P60 family protein [Demetria terragena]